MNEISLTLENNPAAYIRLTLQAKQFSIPKLAKAIGVTRQAIYLVISGRTNSRKIRQAIAYVLEMPIEQIDAALNAIYHKKITMSTKKGRERK